MLVFLALPFLMEDSSLLIYYVVTYTYYVILAQSWNVVHGYTGLIPLGNQLFFGFGAYLTSLLINNGLNAAVSLILAPFIGSLLAVPIARILIRLKGLSFAICSWMFAEAFRIVFLNLPQLGGSQGYSVKYALRLDTLTLYYMSIMLLIVAHIFLHFISSSRIGFEGRAISQNEILAFSLGLNVPQYKIFMLVFSASLASLVGGIYASLVLFVEPYSAFGFSWTIDSLIISMLGGAGNVIGPLLSTPIYMFLMDQLRYAFGEYNIIIIGIFLILLGLIREFRREKIIKFLTAMSGRISTLRK
jgi:branched-chain amino acid transport system permease protein